MATGGQLKTRDLLTLTLTYIDKILLADIDRSDITFNVKFRIPNFINNIWYVRC